MKFLQKRAIIQAIYLIDSGKKKASESRIARNNDHETSRDQSIKISVSSDNDLEEAKEWLQAIIADTEDEDE